MNNPRSYFTRLAISYRMSIAIFWAFDMDLLKHLISGCKTVEQLASACQVKADSVRVLLEIMALTEIIDYDSDDRTYTLKPEFQEILEGEYETIRQEVFLHRTQLAQWLDISYVTRDKEFRAQDYPEKEMFANGDGLMSYLTMVKAANVQHAGSLLKFLAEKLPFSDVGKILDLGGGHAEYAMLLKSHYKDSIVTLLDLESTINCSKELNANDPRAKEIEFVSGDALVLDNIDKDYDVVLMNDLLHSFNFENKVKIVKNALSVLKTGGVLLISKLRHGLGDDSINNAMLSLKLHVNSGEGYLESDQQAADIIAEAGGELVETYLLTQGKVTYFVKKVN